METKTNNQNTTKKELETMKTLETLKNILKNKKERSAWSRGVNVYALEMLEELEDAIAGGYFEADDLAAPKLLQRQLLNGADNWKAYSWGGCSLIYDRDIAERLCSPSELKKTKNGEKAPNAAEAWLDVQARALYQAAALLAKTIAETLEA